MPNRLLTRLKKLEKAEERGKKRVHIIFVEEGETHEQAEERYFSQNSRPTGDSLILTISMPPIKRPRSIENTSPLQKNNIFPVG
jgi:hypothetical protein